MATAAEILDDAQAYADNMKSQAASAADQLAAYVSEISQLLPDYEWLPGFDARRVDISQGSVPTYTAKPFSWDAQFFNPAAVSLPQLDSDYFDYLQTVIERELQNGDGKTNELIAKIFDLINSNETWLSDTTRAAINSAIQTIVPKLANDISTGGTGISQSVQDALFEMMYERDRQIMRDSLVEATGNVSNRGFPLPTSMSQAARDTVIARFEDVRVNRSRDITVLIAERAQNNIQFATNALVQLAGLDQQNFLNLINGFASLSDGSWKRITASIQAGADLEKLKVDYSLGYARVFNEVSNAILARFKAEQDANIADFDARYKIWTGKIDVAKANANVDMAEIERDMKEWQIEFSELARRTEVVLKSMQQDTTLRLDAAKNLADVYKSLLTAALSQTNTIVTQTTTSNT